MPRSNLHWSTPMGIHRLMKEPYDDTEIFDLESDITPLASLLAYLNTGPKYEGQKLRLISKHSGLGSITSNIDFIISNGFAVPVLPNGQELEWITYNNNKYVLVYYSNAPDSTNAFPMGSKADFTFLNDPNKFSILDIVPVFNYSLFKTDSNANQDFLADISVPIRPHEYHIFTQKFNTDYLSTITRPTGTDGINYLGSTSKFEFRCSSGSTTSVVNILPGTGNAQQFSGTFSLYVKANDFVVKGLGVGS